MCPRVDMFLMSVANSGSMRQPLGALVLRAALLTAADGCWCEQRICVVLLALPNRGSVLAHRPRSTAPRK
jgi:hypothetical protein